MYIKTAQKNEEKLYTYTDPEILFHDLPPDIQLEFQEWYIKNAKSGEVNKTMEELWENSNGLPDNSTYNDLKKTRQRIELLKPATRYNLFYKRIALIASLIVFPILGIYIGRISISQPQEINETTYELMECFTNIGEFKHIFLPDSTEVWLNAASLLVYEKDFKGDIRKIYLNGEARFNVYHNPAQPFIVKTNYMDIEALGTVFTVQAYQDAENIITTLETGKIRVNTKNNADPDYFLEPNEQIIFNRIHNTTIKRSVDAYSDARWKDGYLIFNNSSFEYIMKTIERKFGVLIQFDPATFTNRTFTFKFSPEETIEDIMNILKELIGYDYTINDHIIYIQKGGKK